MAKIHRVIQIKLNQLGHWLTNKAYLSGITVTKHFWEFLPTRWRQKSTGIDTEQNYATATLCINWPATDPSSKSQYGEFIGHARQRHDIIGCSETRDPIYKISYDNLTIILR